MAWPWLGKPWAGHGLSIAWPWLGHGLHSHGLATARHGSVDEAAASWAWLVAVGRSGGQEWHFETNARDRGGVWAVPTGELWALGKQLLDANDEGVAELQQAWNAAFEKLKTTTGEA